MANDEMFTPPWVFEALNCTFDLDVASSRNKYVQVPARQIYTIEDDAFKQEWHGLVWMNPPFSKITPWIERWLEHGNGFCLVPLSSNGRWVNKMWESDANVVFMPANMKWVGGQDGMLVTHRWRCALWAIGEDAKAILKRSGIGKVR